MNDRVRDGGGAERSPARTRARLATWRRRHLNVRTVVVLVALSALLVPEAAMIIDAAV